MERSSSSSSVKKGGTQEQTKQQQNAVPLHQQPMPPFMGRPPQMPYPPGAFPFPGGPPMGSPPDQQRFLQMQIHQQQLQLQQMQQQQQVAHMSQQQRVSPPQKLPNPAQQQQMQRQHQLQQQQQLQNPFSSFTTTTTPHSSVKQGIPPAKAKAPSPSFKRPLPPPPTPEQVKLWLSQCDWKDKTILVARQLMGGSSINGFLKATSSAQRIKKQRARQIASVRKRAAADTETATEPPPAPPTENELKVDILNPRTVKKIRLEMQQGAQAVKAMYENIQSIMQALDPTGASVLPPIHRLAATPPKPPMSIKQKVATAKPKTKSAPAPQTSFSPPPALSAQGSELRTNRKHKLVNYTLDVGLSEFDATGKRIFSKKDHNLRTAEILRFRGLRAGDYVAARLSSRDLWILARVVHDYPPLSMNPAEFLKLTPAKRDALFRDKVVVKDAEDKNAEPIAVARRVVLPLPRTYAEAAEWGTRLKKGLRIYAMYPNTTSLYPATVVDNTTYCRGDDDILVVEFDEDERDATGALPQCHIPARFTVMIPREYQNTKKSSNPGKQAPSDPKQAKLASKKATATPDNANDVAVDSFLGQVNEEDFDPLVDFSADRK